LVITISKDIAKESPAQEGNPGEVAEASSILSEIRVKGVERSGEKIAKPLISIVEEVETQLIGKENMQNAPTYEDMEKGKMQKVVSDEMITKGKDDRPQYIEDDDVEIIAI
jgi:pyrimidine operon attenuation protein/uracil phosphoribosyltransferase